jgi:hypothetical protein
VSDAVHVRRGASSVMNEPPTPRGQPAWLNPTTINRGFIAIAAVVSMAALAATAGGAIAAAPLVLAPLLALFWVSQQVRNNAASGWMVFGGGFVIVAPMLLFLLSLAVTSIRPTDGRGAFGLSLMLVFAPVLQLLGVALLFLVARLAGTGPDAKP